MKTHIYFILLVIPFITKAQLNAVQYVDPFIGTTNDANVYPGASVPWGMVTVNPFNVNVAANSLIATSYWKGSEFIYGFSHTRLSGVGCPDMSSILLMPSQGNPSFEKETLKSAYSNETAAPGFYAVDLLRHHIHAAVTATERTGMSEYTFSNSGKTYIHFDAGNGLSSMKGSFVEKVSATQIRGYKTEGGFCGKPVKHTVYFFIEINKPSAIALWNKDAEVTTDTVAGNTVGAWFVFDTEAGEKVIVKTGISYVSMENAKLNLQKEQPGWDFRKTKNAASELWNTQLSKIKAEGSNEDDKKIFYTGIYRILHHPNLINDVNGEYPAMGSHKTMHSKRNRYSVFSLWDTYRTVHPFLTLVYPEIQSNMVSSMVDMYKESNWLPKWELASNETGVMVGDPALPVIADTYLKGIRNFDVATAYEAMLHNASLSDDHNPVRPGLRQYLHYGYIPNDDKADVWGSVSTTLEYCFADWSLAQMAKALNKQHDYRIFMKRSQFYKNLFDTSLLFFRPRLKNKEWLQSFNPITVNGELSWNPSGGPGFVEGSAWQYSCFVPHDIKGLITLMRGKTKFIKHLQKAFDSSYFVLWNEPDMAYPYLFNYIPGEEWRTQQQVSDNIKRYFKSTPAGLPGNDDCGTMSAWLVWSMMGLYPDCPASGRYAVVKPSFHTITIMLNRKYYKGKSFIIKTTGPSQKISKMKLNNITVEYYFIQHSTIANGGKLLLEMGKN